jgi:hypothetical protein
VAVVQYTFTHKQYTEYREQNIHNNKKKKFVKCGLCPVFASYTLAFALQPRKKHGKTSVMVVEKCPDTPVAVVQYTFTYLIVGEIGMHFDHKCVGAFRSLVISLCVRILLCELHLVISRLQASDRCGITNRR